MGDFGSEMAGRQMSEEVMELGYSRSFTIGGHMRWLITMEQLVRTDYISPPADLMQLPQCLP